MIGVYDYTVILTYLSLASSLLGMYQASQGNMVFAICCLIASGVCDMFDGVVARTKKNRTEDEKGFGIQLDSLCDVVCFGVFPAVFLYFNGVNTVVGIIILILYVLCAVIRLAFFNVLESKRQKEEDGCAKFYRGLPVTTIAIILPIFFGISYIIDHAGANQIIYHILPAVVGFLFILDFKVPKPNIGKLFSKKNKEENEDSLAEVAESEENEASEVL